MPNNIKTSPTFSSNTAAEAWKELGGQDQTISQDEAWGTLDDGVDISGTKYNEQLAEEIEIAKFGKSTPAVVDEPKPSTLSK